MSSGHRYVKPTRTVSAPRRLLFLTAEYDHNLELHTHAESRYSARAIWAMWRTREALSWTGDAEPKRFHPDDIWAYTAAMASDLGSLYIVCDNACDLLTASGFWHQVHRGVFVIRVDNCQHCGSNQCKCHDSKRYLGQLVLGEPPTIVKARTGNGTVTITSLRNYTEATWRQISHALSPVDHAREGGRTTSEPDTQCPSWRCSAVAAYIEQLIAAWVDRKCGVWKETVAQLSVAYWKGSHYTRKVCRHESTTATVLERDASFGGRNAVWFYGEIGDRSKLHTVKEQIPTKCEHPTLQEPIYRCDVTSQYPAILSENPFPTRLLQVRDNVSVADLEALTRYYGVIAHVRLRDCYGEIPVRGHKEARYRIGAADTTIAGPELIWAMQRGLVSQCYRVAVYELGYPLQAYARHLIADRERCRREGDIAGEILAKSLANSIGGKFSQRTTRRIPRTDIPSPSGGWGPFQRVRGDGSVERFFAIAGAVYQEVQDACQGKLLAALYCYLTSYGRVQMLQVRESLYPCKPFAQCTDGIWVGDKALSTLQRHGLSSDRIPGRLRLVSRHSFARFVTPVHYYVDGKWTLSGYRHGYVVEDGETVVELRDNNPIRYHPMKPPMQIHRVAVRRNIARPNVDGTIGPDGWHIPNTHRG